MTGTALGVRTKAWTAKVREGWTGQDRLDAELRAEDGASESLDNETWRFFLGFRCTGQASSDERKMLVVELPIAIRGPLRS